MTVDRDYWAVCEHCRSASLPGAVYMLLESYYAGDPTCPHCLTERARWTFVDPPDIEDEGSEARPQGVPAARQDYQGH